MARRQMHMDELDRRAVPGTARTAAFKRSVRTAAAALDQFTARIAVKWTRVATVDDYAEPGAARRLLRALRGAGSAGEAVRLRVCVAIGGQSRASASAIAPIREVLADHART